VRMRGTLALANKNDKPVESVHLFFLQAENSSSISSNSHTGDAAKEDLPVGLKSYKLATPLPRRDDGPRFRPRGADARLPEHGRIRKSSTTEVRQRRFVLPFVGYSTRASSRPIATGKKFEWAPKERMRTARPGRSGLQLHRSRRRLDLVRG